MRSRTYSSRGVVLRQYPLGEADRILSILTSDRGKVRVVAKGVRRPRGRLRGHLDLTNMIDFVAAFGRNLDIVTEAQVRDGHTAVREDLHRLSLAMYVCELADTFGEEGSPSQGLFSLVELTLDRLGSVSDPWLLTRWFEIRLMDVSGFRPQLERCVECTESLEPGDHLLDLGAGGVLCPSCRSMGVGRKVMVTEAAMRVLRYLQRAGVAEHIRPLSLSAAVKDEVEWTLARYVRSVAERDIRSADFARRAFRAGTHEIGAI